MIQEIYGCAWFTISANLRADEGSEIARDVDTVRPGRLVMGILRLVERACPYPDETRSKPEAFGEPLGRVRVERPWKPRSRLGARVARVRVVKRWPERRTSGSRAAIMRE